MTLDQFMNGPLIQRAEFQHPDSMILDPFEIIEDEDQIVEYNGELDPDRNYFNQFSHQLNKKSNYHNEDSFNKYIKRNCYEGGNVSFIHSNIRSIPANLTAFVSYMSSINCDFSVIGFSETWLNSSTIDTYGIDGYSHVGLVRESGKGGGVSLFVCDKMVYYEMSELTMMCDYIECVFIKINYRDYKFIVGVVYRPPNSNMYSRLLNFINKHKIFNKLQFGFRNNHSTFMALVILVENLVNALDNGKCAVGKFLDFQKAFDTVDHGILLDKLYCYGIRGIAHEWFISYLSSRQQSVMYNGHESEFKMMRCGVPQGSILGPLLFLLYINDLTDVSIFL